MTQGITKSTHLIIPEVLADMVSKELEKQIKFTPLAKVDTTLVGQPGDKIKVPAWDYIGDAEDLTEGEEIKVTQMSTTSKEMSIKQIGKAVEITDYALEVGYDDALGEAAKQIATAHAQKIDNDMLAALKTATLEYTATGGLNLEKLEEATSKFEDEELKKMVLLVHPKVATKLNAEARKALLNTETGAKVLLQGAFANILNCEVHRSKKLTENEAFLVKEGALRLVKKRDLKLDNDRDILKKSTVIAADSIYGTYLYDAKKAVKITIS